MTTLPKFMGEECSAPFRADARKTALGPVALTQTYLKKHNLKANKPARPGPAPMGVLP